MATHYKTRAFIFRKENINESDRFFSVFSDEFGKLDIFGKAIRKTASKLRSGIDIFFIADIEFVQGKSKKILTDADAVYISGNIFKSPARFQIASKIAGMLDNFIKGQEKDERIFNLLQEVFLNLDSIELKTEKCQLLYHYFLWNALSLLGYCPEVHKCNFCGEKLNPHDIYFSAKSEGVVCKNCISCDIYAQKINSDIVKLLRIILSKDWQTLSKLKIDPASQNLMLNISERALNSFCPA